MHYFSRAFFWGVGVGYICSSVYTMEDLIIFFQLFLGHDFSSLSCLVACMILSPSLSVSLQSAEVPNWMFITWISQLMAILDKEEGAAIHDILFSLAKDYPQALYYPMKISSCNFKFGSDATGRANQGALSKYVSKLLLLCIYI